MINPFNKIRSEIQRLINRDTINFNVDYPPQHLKQFDFASNIAMILAKENKENPKKIAEEIIHKLNKSNFIKDAEFMGGFINFKVSQEFWGEVCKEFLFKKEMDYFPNLGNDKKTNIEFCSANPTGPIHIGHARGTIYGDVLSNLLKKCDFNVIKEYYINDGGQQIETLIKSTYFRYKGFDIPTGFYPGEYLIDIALEIVKTYGNELTEEDFLCNQNIKKFIVDEIMTSIKKTLKKMNIHHDVFTSEKKIVEDGKIDNAIKVLKSKNLIYTGQLDQPKGKSIDDWEPVELLLFRSTLFGDDVDRPIKKSNGSYTYIMPDIAYHRDKYDRGNEKMIVVLGSDHKGYVKRLVSATKAVTDDDIEIDIKLSEMVNFTKNGEPIKMSKRSGNFLSVDDVLKEIHPDILRFMMLTKKSDTIIDFDIEKAKEQSKDNPVFYVQYCYSRCCSILRKAETEGLINHESDILNSDLSLIQNEKQIELIKKIGSYTTIIENTVKTMELNLLISFAIDLSSNFHSLWNAGEINKDIRFVISDNKAQSLANLGLVLVTKKILKSIFDVLSINAPEKM